MLPDYSDVHSKKTEAFCKLLQSVGFEYNSVMRDETVSEKVEEEELKIVIYVSVRQ